MISKIQKQKFHVKAGDEIVVISGGAKGRRGKVSKVNRLKLWVYIEGLDARAKGEDEGTRALKEKGATAHELDRFRLVKPQLHYIKKNQQNPNGALLWLEGPIHVSNVMKAEKYDSRRVAKGNK